MKTITEVRWSSARDTFIAECSTCTEFLVGLEASGETETEVLCRCYIRAKLSNEFVSWCFEPSHPHRPVISRLSSVMS